MVDLPATQLPPGSFRVQDSENVVGDEQKSGYCPRCRRLTTAFKVDGLGDDPVRSDRNRQRPPVPAATRRSRGLCWSMTSRCLNSAVGSIPAGRFSMALRPEHDHRWPVSSRLTALPGLSVAEGQWRSRPPGSPPVRGTVLEELQKLFSLMWSELWAQVPARRRQGNFVGGRNLRLRAAIAALRSWNTPRIRRSKVLIGAFHPAGLRPQVAC